MRAIQKMSKRVVIRADTSGEKLAEKQVEAHKARLEELLFKAVSRLNSQEIFANSDFITQISVKGFYWKPPSNLIPVFEPWGEATFAENRRIFNAHT